jgi:prephenate dehydrogenase
MFSDGHIHDEVVIIGANGGIGSDLQRNLAELGISVTGFDKVGGQGVIAEDVFALSPEATSQIANAGLVVIAVDDLLAVQIASILLPCLRANAVLMDCTSVKTSYCESVAGISPCAKVSINPLFGPGLDWSNGTMAVTRITDGPAIEHWLDIFRRMGLTLLMIDPETHDRLAAEAQSAVHALIITYLLCADDPSVNFATPPNLLFRMMSARMLTLEAHVYWSVQVANPFSSAARRRLRDALERLDQIIDTRDAAGFQAIWNEQRDKFGPKLSVWEEKCRQIFEVLMKFEHKK